MLSVGIKRITNRVFNDTLKEDILSLCVRVLHDGSPQAIEASRGERDGGRENGEIRLDQMALQVAQVPWSQWVAAYSHLLLLLLVQGQLASEV